MNSFVTAKGSYYELLPNEVYPGTYITRRNKSYHPEHGPKDIGWKDPSVVTVFVDKATADAIGANNAVSSAGVQEFPRSIYTSGDQLIHVSYNSKTKGYGRNMDWASYSLEPKPGLHPLELWLPENIEGSPADALDGTYWRGSHPGNAITELNLNNGSNGGVAMKPFFNELTGEELDSNILFSVMNDKEFDRYDRTNKLSRPILSRYYKKVQELEAAKEKVQALDTINAAQETIEKSSGIGKNMDFLDELILELEANPIPSQVVPANNYVPVVVKKRKEGTFLNPDQYVGLEGKVPNINDWANKNLGSPDIPDVNYNPRSGDFLDELEKELLGKKNVSSKPSPKFMKDTLDKALAYLRNDATGDFAAKDLLNTRVGTMGGTGLGLMALNAATGDGLLENIFKTGAGMAAAGGAGMMFPKAGGLGGVALQAAAGLTGNTLAGIVTNLFGGNDRKEEQMLRQAMLYANQGVPQQQMSAYQVQQPVQYYG